MPEETPEPDHQNPVDYGPNENQQAQNDESGPSEPIQHRRQALRDGITNENIIEGPRTRYQNTKARK
jgi:hypothetical protein